ncbi:PREDICTED: small subunit processome component 20 homolog [Nelumbo nucifera]|uniref:Small subunit processome component 20 homolog n=2 Tax=Nelumbo nucifera TaxID=4432 RepID=A0A1U7ZU01_NELNU|nr:PREDICTED: small subunit processome component 20 homolog [Nelumbo nucifera]DAD31602.1 TPA_asm: hypothetical protein HUJ06_010453 [Nelumbo nucifera]
MATRSHALAVKSLNKSTGRKRFVFKTFSQRVEEIDINVYRSLDPLKSEPSKGSSFFRDCLVEWRELNTAEDFISFYEEMMPWVQTLPQVLLHKETIMHKLLSRLQIKARLSLEPILRLIAALSRDLLEDFCPFLQRITDCIVSLLKDGAEREPEILEQIFTSWSCIMMYLQKYLVRDVVHVLKITVHLRYYPKDYIQEFMADAISFLLRNAPEKQLKKGIRKIINEVVKRPSDVRKSGVSALLWYTMRGTPSRLHSRAEQVLLLLVNNSIFEIGDKSAQGSDTIVEVVTITFQRLCEELQQELNLIFDCLLVEISDCVIQEQLLHLTRLLSILISTVQFTTGGKVSDYQPMLNLVGLLMRTYIKPSGNGMVEDHSYDLVNKILQFMLCLLDGLHNSNDASAIASISSQWAPIFELRNPCLLNFIKELLGKDPSLAYVFRSHILSALSDMVEASPEEVMYLILIFFERVQVKMQLSDHLHGTSGEVTSKMCNLFQKDICHWVREINDLANGNSLNIQFHESKLALLWGTLSCYPHITGTQAESSLIMDLVNALDQLLRTGADKIAGLPIQTWQSLIGAGLASYHKLILGNTAELAETSNFLRIARQYRSSSHILFSVADFLDSVHGAKYQEHQGHKIYHPELKAEKAIDAVKLFSENLCHSEKDLRLSTLRILCHYELLDAQLSKMDEPPKKKLKTDGSQLCCAELQCHNVVQLLSIESTPLSISTSRKIVVLISRIQMDLSAGRISEAYAPLLLNGVIGIFHNRFGHLWEPTLECLVVLINKYCTLVWDKFVCYLEQCQSKFLTFCSELGSTPPGSSNKSCDLVERFNSFVSPDSDSTPCATVVSLLLQLLQKIPTISESRSRHLIPLFLKFLGYTSNDFESIGSFNSYACKVKEWKGVLKEWLNLLKLMRNPKSLYLSKVIKDILINRLLDENDANIQMQVLGCLLNWKDDFLVPYEQHLINLIISKSLREELATWTLSKESPLVQEQHRMDLIPLVIRILIPKIRKLKTLASRKNPSIHHRRAVLCFLAQMDIDELPLLFTLLLKPLQSNFTGTEGSHNFFWSHRVSMDEFQASGFINFFSLDNTDSSSWKKTYGFLHVIEDILRVFDELHIKPFLNLLMGFVVRVMESCTLRLDSAKSSGSCLVGNFSSTYMDVHDTTSATENPTMSNTTVKQLKELRSLCLKIISFTLNKYESHDFGGEFWDLFFISAKPLIDSFKQGGSSSERPSSLFSCFFAMSKSQALISFLCRDKTVVSSIFSILTVQTATDAVVSYVLGFIENLLNLNNDLDHHEDNAVERVLLPNLEALICSLHCHFHRHNKTARKLVKWPEKRELVIFKLLSKYVKDPSLARKFVDILLPFLAEKARKTEECMEGLQVIQSIVPVLENDISGEILKAISPFLISGGLDVRLSICDLLDCLAMSNPSLVFLARLVRELNAISAMEMGEMDFDTRISAYENISPEFFSTIKDTHALIILSHCVYDMSSEELILRQSASRLLLSFFQFAAQILGSEAQGDEQIYEARGDVDISWTKVSVQRIIEKFFLKHMGTAMCKEVSIQKEWIALLREILLKLPEMRALNSFRSLCSEDAEVDFFNNILHLQKHRRARALSRFRNIFSTGDFPENIIKKIFVPLFFSMLFDVKDGKGEHVRNACLETLACISGHMKWDSYRAFLVRCFKEMTLRPNKQKVLLRLISSVLDQFHFSETCYRQGPKDKASEDSSPGITGMGSSIILHRCTNSSELTEVQLFLQKTILPKIHKLKEILNAESEEVNVTITLVELKLLKLLPLDTMESQLPSIIHHISNFLKNRKVSVRDEARSALAACCKVLGPEYFQFIVKVLRATLKRGYELHVLGYTLNFLLSKCLFNPVMGKLDYCLEELLSIAEDDILGDVAEQKEVEKIASKMKETRKCKSFETLELIAEGIMFKTHALKLLSPVKSHLQKHITPKMKAKFQTMLNHIAAGIESNPSVDSTDLFIFVYGLIEDGSREEDPQGHTISKPAKQCSNELANESDSSGCAIGSESQISYLVTVFALGVLRNRLNNMKLDGKDEKLLSLLDPFVKILGNCLSSKYEDILSAALRCLTPLIRMPLPSLEVQADKIKILLLDIAQKSGIVSSPLMQSCLRLLTVLLRCTRITLSTDQLHMLIQFPLFVDLERNPSFLALSLLRAIVGRNLVAPEIYDLVTKVSELMVTTQIEPIRKKCSQILLQFLLDYRLSEKRLQQHLDFLLSNLSYEHSSGREAVLEMLHAILMKFPKSVVDGQAHTLFLHLVVCLANDNDNKVHSMVGAVIKLLIARTSQNSLHPILEYSLLWYMGKEQHLWCAAAQVLGLLVEVLKKGFQRHINNILPVTRDIFKLALGVVKDKQMDCANEDKIPLWKEAYYSLIMLDKMLLQFPELYLERNLEEIWEAVCNFLLHPHMWVRSISNRLVSSYFATSTENSRLNPEKLNMETFLLMKPSRLFWIAVSLFRQLRAGISDDAASNIITQNLVFATCGVHSLVGQMECMDIHRFWSALQVHEQGYILAAFQMLGARKERTVFASLTSSKYEHDKESSQDLQSLLVSPLLKKMGKMALQMADTQMKIVFNCFRMISAQIGQEDCQKYAIYMLLPLYKVCEGFAGKVITDGIKHLAEEVRESMRGTLGAENFVHVYNQIRKNLKEKRDKRKQEEKLMAVINPVRNAKRKLRLAAKHRAHKKRKIMTMKMGRWRS